MHDRFSAVAQRAARANELRAHRTNFLQACESKQRTLRALEAQTARLRSELTVADRNRFAWGDFDRARPFSDVWGKDRGRCIDRYYIEQFLERNAADISGHVLEVHDRGYTTAFGGEAVHRSDVIDIDPTNPRATIIADLRNAPAIPSRAYDCVILTQTLHIIYEADAVVRECARMLRPSGVLLATVPCASRIAPEQGLDRDFWRFTPASLTQLVSSAFSPERTVIRAYGNLTVNLAFFYGLACHELRTSEFESYDSALPLILSVRAQKSPATEGEG